MLQGDFVEILQKYKNDLYYNTIIDNIDKSITEIIKQLKRMITSLSDKLYNINLSDNMEDSDNSDDILADIKSLKKQIISITKLKESILSCAEKESRDIVFDNKLHVFLINDDICPKCNVKLIPYEIRYQKVMDEKLIDRSINGYICPCCERLFLLDYEIEKIDFSNTNLNFEKPIQERRQLNFHDIIVLSTLTYCTIKEHNVIDITAQIPIFNSSGNIEFIEINVAYCPQCDRYIMLKADFKQIEGIIACQVVDQTTQYYIENRDEIEIKQRESILYQYGYNVKTKDDLSSKQRHMILASVIESGILTRNQICSHLDTLIERGNKIEKWETATNKWKQDRHFVKSYNASNLPKVLFDKVIVKYNQLALDLQEDKK